MQKSAKLPAEFLNSMAEIIKLLGHGQRLQIIEHLDINGESKVSEIVAALSAPQGAISQHLNKMRMAGILSCRRDSREVYYQIATQKATTILNCIRQKHEDMQ